MRNGPRKQRPKTVARDAHRGKKRTQYKNLQRHVSARCVRKLREKCKEKQRGLRIQNVNDDALPEDSAQLGAWSVLRKLKRFLAPQLLYTQVDQVCRAQILYRAEGDRRGHQQRRQANRRRSRMNQRADTDSQCGDEPRAASLADCCGSSRRAPRAQV